MSVTTFMRTTGQLQRVSDSPFLYVSEDFKGVNIAIMTDGHEKEQDKTEVGGPQTHC